jgi:hypothetical protein
MASMEVSLGHTTPPLLPDMIILTL